MEPDQECKTMSQLNWKTWNQLDALLSQEDARTIQRQYFSKSYWDSVRGGNAVEKYFGRALAIKDITADTPITIPSKVKADLNLLVLSDINAILRFTDKFKFDHPRQNQVYSFSNLSDFEHGYLLLFDHLSLI